MTTLNWLRDHTPAVARPALGTAHRVLDDHLTSDRRFIEREFVRVFGRAPDLDHPRSFSEKLQWRKLHDRRPLHSLVSDKVAVRDYIAARVGTDYLVPLLGVFERPEDVPWAELPTPYVVKASHGCQWNLFVFDPAEVDRSEMNCTLHRWLRTNFYYHAREWAYKDIPRRIIIERFIGPGREAPDDFKFLCFDGLPQVLYVRADRFTQPTQTWYDTTWTTLRFRTDPGPAPPRPAPAALPEMLEVARKLSEDLDFIRVDLYCIEGRVYCGELTLYPGAGFEPYDPPEADEWLGRFWTLPEHA